jgi:hypothetical protein
MLTSQSILKLVIDVEAEECLVLPVKMWWVPLYNARPVRSCAPNKLSKLLSLKYDGEVVCGHGNRVAVIKTMLGCNCHDIL